MSADKKSILLLISRIIIGGIFVLAGWMKVSAMGATVGMFASIGIPAFLAYIVGYGELLGGILIVLGLWTCLSAAFLTVIMLFAVWFTRSMGIQGIMTPLAVLGGLVGIMASGAGQYSVPTKKGASTVA